jgi:hypothetical protein
MGRKLLRKLPLRLGFYRNKQPEKARAAANEELIRDHSDRDTCAYKTDVRAWPAQTPTTPVPTSLLPCWVQTPPLRV